MSGQTVAEAAAYSTHNKHMRRKSMPSAGFEHAIPAIKPLQIHTFSRTTTGIGLKNNYYFDFSVSNIIFIVIAAAF
jgi:hypothetical protein